ncbi:MAG: hypothetical protein EPN91_03940 [Salinibacterium sp.]|nr:MAG: hypothetical protein EPN91_03940 [Salinibacterium sp.]
MPPDVRSSLIRPAKWVWVRSSARSVRHLPRPYDEPVITVAGANPVRVLFLGSGLAVGYGVHSHQLGMGGELARHLAASSGRGTSVEVVAGDDMSVRQASRRLAHLDLNRFDVVVLTVGSYEATTLAQTRAWARLLPRISDVLRTRENGMPETFFLGIAPLTDLVVYPAPMRPLIAERIETFNKYAREVSDDLGFTFVPFEPEPFDFVSRVNRSTYARWASLIVPPMSSKLQNAS